MAWITRFVAVLALCAIFLFLSAPWAAAQATTHVQGPQGLGSAIASAGAAGVVLLLFGAGVIAFTFVGFARAKTREQAGTWTRVVRGLGEFAFLLAIVSCFVSLRSALGEIVERGAAVTPADLASGLEACIARIIIGGVVALLALLGAGLIHLRATRTNVVRP